MSGFVVCLFLQSTVLIFELEAASAILSMWFSLQ
jgi:hypothetical protein